MAIELPLLMPDKGLENFSGIQFKDKCANIIQIG